MAFQQQVATDEQVDLGAVCVHGGGAGAIRSEDLIVAPADRQQPHASVAQAGV